MAETSPDQDLARAAQGGSRDAFGELALRHYEAVYAFLFSLLGNHADAEDLTQECFLRAQRKIRSFHPERPFRPWVFAVARRLAIAHWRRRRPTASLDDVPTPMVEASPHRRLDAEALWALARQHLKPDEFSALWLHYREDLPVADLARALGKTHTHAKVILHRARKKLRPRLEAQSPDESPAYSPATEPTP